LDRGRHLVVDLSPSDLRASARHHAWWDVQPLPTESVVVDVSTVPPQPIEHGIQALLASVSPNTFRSDLSWLVERRTRHSLRPEFGEAVTWALKAFGGMGYQATMYQFALPSGASCYNVVAERPGEAAGSPGVVVITAHLDSMNWDGGPTADAPGADDNASGCAGVLEVARVLLKHRGPHDLRFILFGGEEQDLSGSTAYVKSLRPDERDRIRAVMNMDMIGVLTSEPPTVLLEGAPVSEPLMNALARAARTYTPLEVELSGHPFRTSDHWPFLGKGLPAVLVMEGSATANRNVHSAKDTLDCINYDLALAIVRMVVATIATIDGSRANLDQRRSAARARHTVVVPSPEVARAAPKQLAPGACVTLCQAPFHRRTLPG